MLSEQQRDRILKDANVLFGRNDRFAIAQEECAELITAISHFKRERVDLLSLMEEVADVLVVVRSLQLLLGAHAVDAIIDKKLMRLDKKIWGEASPEVSE
jgi:NTP pyrophosphatase (non-canonical NTP hydrolase)